MELYLAMGQKYRVPKKTRFGKGKSTKLPVVPKGPGIFLTQSPLGEKMHYSH